MLLVLSWASQLAIVVKKKKTTCQGRDMRDTSLIPGSGRSPGEGASNFLRCSCLENPMDRGAWWATVHGVAKSQKRLKQRGVRAVLSWRLFSVPRSHPGCGVTFTLLRLLYTGTAFWSFLVFDDPDGLRSTSQTFCRLSLSLDLSDLLPTVKLRLWLWGLKTIEVRALTIPSQQGTCCQHDRPLECWPWPPGWPVLFRFSHGSYSSQRSTLSSLEEVTKHSPHLTRWGKKL